MAEAGLQATETDGGDDGPHWVRLLPADGQPVVATRLRGAWLFPGHGDPIEDRHVEVLSERLAYRGRPIPCSGN